MKKSKRYIKSGTSNFGSNSDVNGFSFPLVAYIAENYHYDTETDTETDERDYDTDQWEYEDAMSDAEALADEMDIGFYPNNTDNYIQNDWAEEPFGITIRDGYYEGIYIKVLEGPTSWWDSEDEEEVPYDDVQMNDYADKINAYLDKLCKEYGWMKLGVAARFDNGETWYSKIDSAKKSKKSKKEKSADEKAKDEGADITCARKPVKSSVDSRMINFFNNNSKNGVPLTIKPGINIEDFISPIDNNKFELKVWDRLRYGVWYVVPRGNNTDVTLVVDLENQTVTERERRYYGFPNNNADVSSEFNFSTNVQSSRKSVKSAKMSVVDDNESNELFKQRRKVLDTLGLKIIGSSAGIYIYKTLNEDNAIYPAIIWTSTKINCDYELCDSDHNLYYSGHSSDEFERDLIDWMNNVGLNDSAIQSSRKPIKSMDRGYLKPEYDSRASFYNKAETDDNKLYSYGTLVAEIIDGKPVLYPDWDYSQTTLRHVREWLKQNGFEAGSKSDIAAKYEIIQNSRKPIKSGMSYEQVLRDFTSEGKPWGDYWSMQQDWTAYVDGLEKDGLVDYEESKNWDSPCTPETFKEWITSGVKPVKSGYYDDPENHPEGGGTCDYCGEEVMPGDGYEPDFESSFDEARSWLYVYLSADPENADYLYAPESDWEFANWLGGDWTDDDVRDMEQEVIEIAFDNGDYMCPSCHTEKIKKAAKKYVDDNFGDYDDDEIESSCKKLTSGQKRNKESIKSIIG